MKNALDSEGNLKSLFNSVYEQDKTKEKYYYAVEVSTTVNPISTVSFLHIKYSPK